MTLFASFVIIATITFSLTSFYLFSLLAMATVAPEAELVTAVVILGTVIVILALSTDLEIQGYVEVSSIFLIFFVIF